MLDSRNVMGAKRLNRHTACRRAGQVDTTDLVVGVVLAGVVPLLCFVGLTAFSSGDLGSVPGRRSASGEVPPPDAQELDMHLKHAENLRDNAKNTFMKYVDLVDDQFLKDDYRQWASRCIANCISKIDEVESMIALHPDGDATFGHIFERTRSLRAAAEALQSQVSGDA